MMRTILLIILFINTISINLVAQEAETTQTYEVVTAEGRKTVNAEEANKDLYEKLNKKKNENEQEREEKRNTKRILKIAGRVALAAILFGGIALWRNRKKKN